MCLSAIQVSPGPCQRGSSCGPEGSGQHTRGCREAPAGSGVCTSQPRHSAAHSATPNPGVPVCARQQLMQRDADLLQHDRIADSCLEEQEGCCLRGLRLNDKILCAGTCDG